jgi:hypothetical protein
VTFVTVGPLLGEWRGGEVGCSVHGRHQAIGGCRVQRKTELGRSRFLRSIEEGAPCPPTPTASPPSASS